MLITTNEAVALLQKNETVAIPTETVYGLASIITSESALKKIFEIKLRPFFDPLIVHVLNINQAKTLTTEWPEIAEVLAQKFWPGPLTLVLKKNHLISDLITSGLERVGLRCPQHPVALEILRKIKVPLAAPSANLFGRTSPTNARHVESEFSGLIPVVDGGSCDVGIESTVLLVDGSEMAILRPGKILSHDIENVLIEKSLPFSWKKEISKTESPGHMKHHYMPAKPLFWIDGNKSHTDLILKLNTLIKTLPDQVEGVALVKPNTISTLDELALPLHANEAARLLYSELRRLGDGSADALLFFYKPYMSSPEWLPILERIKKASSGVIS